MNLKKVLFTLLAVMMIAVVGCSNDSSSQPAPEPNETEQPAPQPTVYIPQLNEETIDAATMVLISAPTLMPADHESRWNPQQGQESCLVCHMQAEAIGARVIPTDHFVDEDRSKGIFGARNSCITCHGLDTGDTRPAFNRD